jgi:protein-L-isoaspartate O-methyltransferase
MSAVVESVRNYWDAHPLGLQYVSDQTVEIGSPAFFNHIKPWMNPYKFPWIMDRIESEAAGLRGKKLLEIGCGMGYDSLEFIKRGVNVTAIDLTPAAIDFAKRHFETVGAVADEVKVDNARTVYCMPLAIPQGRLRKHAAYSSQVDAP